MATHKNSPTTVEYHPPVKKIRITAAEFQQICELKQKHRKDWPAVFSTNPNDEIWGFRRRGHTPESERHCAKGISELLDRVGGILSELRELGGRFFIDERGAFFKPCEGEEIQFIKWDSGTEKLSPPPKKPAPNTSKPQSITLAQLLDRRWNWREHR